MIKMAPLHVPCEGTLSLPVSHAASTTKYNCQFDKGPKLSWDYMSGTSKCDTALPPSL